MPSSEHEVLAYLFRQRPALAGELLAMLGALPRRALSAELLGTARLDSESFRQLEPAQYAADRVVLFGGRARPDFGVVVEVQRGRACRDVDTLNRWIDRAALVPSAEALLE